MKRNDAVAQFIYDLPSLDSYWRAIVLFGRNAASYKFALASALLEIGVDSGEDNITLEQLALPYATRIAEHLRTADKQGTFKGSQFLDACRAFNRGEIDAEKLRQLTVRLGFGDVIDAFHNIDNAEVPQRFYVDERKLGGPPSIRLTDNLRKLL